MNVSFVETRHALSLYDRIHLVIIGRILIGRILIGRIIDWANINWANINSPLRGLNGVKQIFPATSFQKIFQPFFFRNQQNLIENLSGISFTFFKSPKFFSFLRLKPEAIELHSFFPQVKT
jgi:hypothetical protein